MNELLLANVSSVKVTFNVAFRKALVITEPPPHQPHPKEKKKERMNCYTNSCDSNEFQVEGIVIRETRFCASGILGHFKKNHWSYL